MTTPEPLTSAPHAEEQASIAIPACDGERGLAPTPLDAPLGTQERLAPPRPIEILVVDDGSRDGTAEALAPFGGRVRVIRQPRNRGDGAALETVIPKASCPWVLVTDADGTDPNEHIPELPALRADDERGVGARTGGKPHIPLPGRPPGWPLRKLASWLGGQAIPDLDSGLRPMRREVLLKFEHLLPAAFSRTTPVALAMLSEGFAVSSVPIDDDRREGKSKIRPIADTLSFLELRVRSGMSFEPLRICLPPALTFILLAIGGGVGSWTLTGPITHVTAVMILVTGIRIAALGMPTVLLDRRVP